MTMPRTDSLPGSAAEDGSSRARIEECISLLRERARRFERQKLFHLSRALRSIAQEIDSSST